MKKLFFILILMGVTVSIAFAQKVTMISTTISERWVENKIGMLKNPIANPDINIYMDSLLQDVVGFGGTFNELGWDALQCLSDVECQKVISSLFASEGINFSLGRTPIGASDYAFSYYSYNDVKDDYVMRNFSIDRDRYILIPYIKEALKIRPDLKIWASPWTPPIWMKVNEHYSRVLVLKIRI